MKKMFISGILVLAASFATAQDQDQPQSLRHFTKIVASPHINVVLQKGDRESIRLVCNNISPEKVNVRVTGKRLRIYLDHAQVVERQERIFRNHHPEMRGIYQNVSVTAYVTYRELKDIEVRGNQELVCDDEISSSKLKLRAYGETDIQLAKVNTNKFKASLYGENKLKIKSGGVGHQVYRLFGENRIDTRGLKSESASTRIYGEGKLSLSVSDRFDITAFGEPEINVSGSPNINKGIVIGHADIRRQ